MDDDELIELLKEIVQAQADVAEGQNVIAVNFRRIVDKLEEES